MSDDDLDLNGEEGASKDDKRALFKAYEDAAGAKAKAEKTLQEASKKQTEAVKAIFEKCGKGPFKWKGKVITVVKKGDTYFFRGPKEREAEEI